VFAGETNKWQIEWPELRTIRIIGEGAFGKVRITPPPFGSCVRVVLTRGRVWQGVHSAPLAIAFRVCMLRVPAGLQLACAPCVCVAGCMQVRTCCLALGSPLSRCCRPLTAKQVWLGRWQETDVAIKQLGSLSALGVDTGSLQHDSSGGEEVVCRFLRDRSCET